ncbi:MAG: cysteine hydrolase, partial [Actinobacteria bacterium]|nr:cysteine hydrolase [Actinomycetota bacterium]
MSNAKIELRTAVLLVVDVQNGFVTEDTKQVVLAIQNLAARWNQADGTTIYSRYFNYPGSSFETSHELAATVRPSRHRYRVGTSFRRCALYD